MNAPTKPIDLSRASKAALIDGRGPRTERRPRIALLGLFGCGNFGNDGSLEAMLNFLRQARPQAELTCICANPDLIGSRYGISTLPISSTWDPPPRTPTRFGRAHKVIAKLADLYRTVKHIRGFDVVIVPGTGILDDFGERPYGMPWDIFRWCVGARLLGAKIAFVSIGAGPIKHPLSRKLMMWAARVAHYRSYRDVMSKDFVTSVGLDAAGDPMYPDIAFGLPTPQLRQPRDGARLTIGIGVMNYFGWYGFADGSREIYERYIEKVTRFAVYTLDRGHDIRLLVGETTDAQAIDDVMRRVKAERPESSEGRLTTEPAASLQDIMRQMSTTDIVVTTRYHNVVCALILAKPTISLGYSKKNDYLMAAAGQSAYCQHVDDFDVDALIDQFENLRASARDNTLKIRSHIRDMQARLKGQEAFLSAELL
jgi:polysaccharide pyruvyl transferase WcaK-like protein